MEKQSTLDKWLWSNEQRVTKYESTLRLTKEEEQTLKSLIQEERFWEAFKRLNLLFLYCSHQLEPGDAREGTKNTQYVMCALLDWISENTELIDSIISGVGADGYAISPSIYGMNISVSFTSQNNPALIRNPGVERMVSVRKTGARGMTHTTRHRTTTTSPSAQRSNVMNPNNPAFRAARSNRSNQMNPNSPAYRSSRSGSGKSRK